MSEKPRGGGQRPLKKYYFFISKQIDKQKQFKNIMAGNRVECLIQFISF